MSKRTRRTVRVPSKRFGISNAFLYGLTRGLARDRHDPAHHDPAPKGRETHDTGDIPDLADGTRGSRILARVARKLCERIWGRRR